MVHKKKYRKHKKTKHRTLPIPEGFEFARAVKDPLEPRALKVVFKKKGT
jgi:hypothetical protein